MTVTMGALAPGRRMRLPGAPSLFVRDSAPSPSAPAVVLLHGLGASADLNWCTSIPALSRGFREAPDLYGHGQWASTSGRFTFEAADHVAALAGVVAWPVHRGRVLDRWRRPAAAVATAPPARA